MPFYGFSHIKMIKLSKVGLSRLSPARQRFLSFITSTQYRKVYNMYIVCCVLHLYSYVSRLKAERVILANAQKSDFSVVDVMSRGDGADSPRDKILPPPLFRL